MLIVAYYCFTLYNFLPFFLQYQWRIDGDQRKYRGCLSRWCTVYNSGLIVFGGPSAIWWSRDYHVATRPITSSITSRHSSKLDCLISQSINRIFITFRVSRRRREMYCVHACLCVCLSVCLSAAACLHYCTDPDVTWWSGRGCPLVVHYCNRCTGCVAMAT